MCVALCEIHATLEASVTNQLTPFIMRERKQEQWQTATWCIDDLIFLSSDSC